MDSQQQRSQQLPAQLHASATDIQPSSLQAASWGMAGTSSQRSLIHIDAHPGVPDNLLYLCTHADGSRTVVKFTTTYCLRLHELLADADLAPKLLDSDHLPGGWFKVEMGYLDPDEWESFQEVLDEGTEAEIELAHAAVVPCLERLHSMPGGPWVWGDARNPNIMLRWWESHWDDQSFPHVSWVSSYSMGPTNFGWQC